MDGVIESRRGGRGGGVICGDVGVSLLLGVVTSIPRSGNRGHRRRVEGSFAAIKTLGAALLPHHIAGCLQRDS